MSEDERYEYSLRKENDELKQNQRTEQDKENKRKADFLDDIMKGKGIDEIKQNEKIVDEIRKIVKKESKWFEEIADKTFTPYFDYRVIIEKLQSILNGDKK